MPNWIETNDPPKIVFVECEIKHCNEKLNLENEIVKGQMKDDGFYLSDGGELSWNWDIIKWRRL